jgi:hypothetical protein
VRSRSPVTMFRTSTPWYLPHVRTSRRRRRGKSRRSSAACEQVQESTPGNIELAAGGEFLAAAQLLERGDDLLDQVLPQFLLAGLLAAPQAQFQVFQLHGPSSAARLAGKGGQAPRRERR